MSEQKMREALERIASEEVKNLGSARIVAREALAQQPAAVVELTDAEIVNAMLGSNSWPNVDRTCFRTIHAVRAVIAAHEAKRNGGGA